MRIGGWVTLETDLGVVPATAGHARSEVLGRQGLALELTL